MATDSYRKLTPGPSSGLRGRDGAWRRQLALEFTNQALRSWGPRELVGFCQALLASGHLKPQNALAGRITVLEGSHPAIALQTSPWSDGDAGPDVKPVLRAAWLRVLGALRGMRHAPQDDRFLNAAIYTQRVERVTNRDGTASWEPRLKEGQPLSDWVLALLAADALTDRDTYDRHLQVCAECSYVAFSPLSEHSCEDAADGSTGLARRATTPDLRSALEYKRGK